MSIDSSVRCIAFSYCSSGVKGDGFGRDWNVDADGFEFFGLDETLADGFVGSRLMEFEREKADGLARYEAGLHQRPGGVGFGLDLVAVV